MSFRWLVEFRNPGIRSKALDIKPDLPVDWPLG